MVRLTKEHCITSHMRPRLPSLGSLEEIADNWFVPALGLLAFVNRSHQRVVTAYMLAVDEEVGNSALTSCPHNLESEELGIL